MSWQTNSVLIKIRSIARGLGLTRILVRVVGRTGYERAFDEALFSAVREGDIVWDVGANVGYYTKRLAAVVGNEGHVVAFEPFPATAERLRSNLAEVRNHTLHVVALGAERADVSMEAGGDALGATNRIVADASDGVNIRVETADHLRTEGDVPPPNIVKIDTEGFELDVLQGMTGLIGSSQLRAIFIEVHFGLLAQRGLSNAPSEIERLLKNAGFLCRWVDASHIAAERV